MKTMPKGEGFSEFWETPGLDRIGRFLERPERDIAMNIRTNYHRRELKSFVELPEEVRENFNYIHEEDSYSPRFVKYKGEWYDISDCDIHKLQLQGVAWDCGVSETFFSSVLFRFPPEDDYETVIVAFVWS